MQSGDPNKAQSKGKFQLNIDTSSNQMDVEDSKNEQKSQKLSSNPPQLTEESILTTFCSIASSQKNPLITINTNQKKNKIYSYKKEYFDELYQNLILDEIKFYQKINPNYMSTQEKINDKMRAILVDWLVGLHYKLNLKKKTLFLCVFIIDAFLSIINIPIEKLQLLGITSLLIACKQNEVEYTPLNTLLKFSDNFYTLEELKNMEQIVLKKLSFDILAPTAEEFFEINAYNFQFTEIQKFFGEYFLDISLIDYYLLKYKQSTIAVACAYIVAKFFNLNGVHSILDNTSSEVNHHEVKDCVKHLLFLVKCLSKSSLENIKKKFMSDKYLNVAKLCEEN